MIGKTLVLVNSKLIHIFTIFNSCQSRRTRYRQMAQESENDIREEILGLIRQSKLDLALDRLRLWIERAELINLEHDITILSQDYHDLKTDKLRNVATAEALGVRENQLIQSLIFLAEKTQNGIIGISSITSDNSKENTSKTSSLEKELAKNKGCLFALSNRRAKFTLQLILASVLFIWGGRTLLNYFDSTDISSEKIAKSLGTEPIKFAPGSIEKELVEFLTKDSVNITKTFSGKGQVNITGLLDILKNYPEVDFQIDNFSTLNLKEFQQLQDTIFGLGIAPSRVSIEAINAFSTDIDYKIIIVR